MEDNIQPFPSTSATQTTQSSPADRGVSDLNAQGAANNALSDKQLTLASIRSSQQFACLVFFTRAFGAALGLRPVTAGAFEEVLVSLEDYPGFWGELMPRLLSSGGQHAAGDWESNLRDTFTGLWEAAAFPNNPLEECSFYGLTPMQKVSVLYAVCDWKLQATPAWQGGSHQQPSNSGSCSLADLMRRRSALGSSSQGDHYYFIAGPPVDPRLYKEAADGVWSTPFTTLEQLQTWEQQLATSSDSSNQALLQALQQQVLPAVAGGLATRAAPAAHPVPADQGTAQDSSGQPAPATADQTTGVKLEDEQSGQMEDVKEEAQAAQQVEHVKEEAQAAQQVEDVKEEAQAAQQVEDVKEEAPGSKEQVGDTPGAKLREQRAVSEELQALPERAAEVAVPDGIPDMAQIRQQQQLAREAAMAAAQIEAAAGGVSGATGGPSAGTCATLASEAAPVLPQQFTRSGRPRRAATVRGRRTQHGAGWSPLEGVMVPRHPKSYRPQPCGPGHMDLLNNAAKNGVEAVVLPQGTASLPRRVGGGGGGPAGPAAAGGVPGGAGLQDWPRAQLPAGRGAGAAAGVAGLQQQQMMAAGRGAGDAGAGQGAAAAAGRGASAAMSGGRPGGAAIAGGADAAAMFGQNGRGGQFNPYAAGGGGGGGAAAAKKKKKPVKKKRGWKKKRGPDYSDEDAEYNIENDSDFHDTSSSSSESSDDWESRRVRSKARSRARPNVKKQKVDAADMGSMRGQGPAMGRGGALPGHPGYPGPQGALAGLQAGRGVMGTYGGLNMWVVLAGLGRVGSGQGCRRIRREGGDSHQYGGAGANLFMPPSAGGGAGVRGGGPGMPGMGGAGGGAAGFAPLRPGMSALGPGTGQNPQQAALLHAQQQRASMMQQQQFMGQGGRAGGAMGGGAGGLDPSLLLDTDSLLS
eukprot:gene11816-11960_t